MIQFKYVVFLITLIFCIHSIYTLEIQEPCSLSESIILNENQKQSDNSYIVDNVKIPQNLIFTIKNEVRGCICLVKICLPWCCSHMNETMTNLECTGRNENDIIHDINVTLIDSNGLSNKNINFLKHFYLQKNKNLGCETERSYALKANLYKEDKWELHTNGSLKLYNILDETYEYIPQDEFCFSLFTYYDNKTITKHTIGPHICIIESEDIGRHIFFGVSFLLSQPFMIITIIIYLAIPKLRNLHGKALVCYLISLSISYFCLAYILLGTNHQTYFGFCTFVGYVGYISIMSAYFWLSAISFDLWFNFNSYDRARALQNIRFYTYCGICYGFAIIYTLAAYIVQNSDASDEVKPGFGYLYCYLNTDVGYSAVIWLYQPLICVITFNILMFVLTWLKIKTVTTELTRVLDKDNSKRNLKNQRNKFHIFFRLFVIMGVSWIAEIASYFMGNKYKEIFYVTDLLNAMQGLLIFLTFIVKKETRKLITKRFQNISKNQKSSRSTTAEELSFNVINN